MKKYSLILLTLLLGASLMAGCSCQHEWTEAGCTAPKTCLKCEVTDGEALGHSWKEADCVTAKTCSRCASTEGEPLGHSWQEATCNAAKTCSICAVTEGQPLEHTWDGEATLYTAPLCTVCGAEGEPLPGYFDQNGLVPNLHPGEAADYTTNTFVRPDLNTTGLLLASGMEIFDYNSTHRTKKGFEWRRIDVSLLLSDNHAHMYGSNITFARADFYEDQELKPAKRQESFTVTYQGKEYRCQAYYDNTGFYYDGGDIVYGLTCHVQVPIGYDGVVLAFHNGSIDVEGMHLHEVNDDDMILLRLA